MPRLILIGFCLGLGLCSSTQAEVVKLAAASSLRPLMEVLIADYRQQQPATELRVTYGSSGVFSTQLQRGAPFEVFISADSRYLAPLLTQQLAQEPPYLLALGRLVFFSRDTLSAETAQEALEHWLADSHPNAKLAIANPRHAPYGQAALEWLTHHALRPRVDARLVQGDNAAQAVQFVVTGAARVGILAWPLLIQHPSLPGQAWLIPMSAHADLDHHVVLMKGASEDAQQFYRFLQQPNVRLRLIEFGYGIPE